MSNHASGCAANNFSSPTAEYSTGFRLHFIKAETKYIEECLDFLRTELVHCNSKVMKDKIVKATGGGALKYKDLITSQLGCQLDAEGIHRFEMLYDEIHENLCATRSERLSEVSRRYIATLYSNSWNRGGMRILKNLYYHFWQESWENF